MASHEHSIDEQIKALYKAEQSQFFTENRVKKWMDQVLQVDGDRLPWHIKRTYGFGGSEVGVLVAERNGLVDAFESARNIVAAKLLINPPSAAIPAMERGQYMEDIVAKKFMSDWAKHKPVRDEEAMSVMSKAIGYRNWQNGSPDDVVILGKNRKRYVIDYKAPGDGGYEIKGVPMRYAAQLHHYGMIADKCGIKVDGYLLVAIDYRYWKLETLPVPFDPELQEQILEAGDYYWNEFVMQDRLPDFARKQYFDKSALADRETIEDDAVRFLVHKRIADLGYAEAKKIQTSIGSRLIQHRVGDSKVQLVGGLLDISAKPTFNSEMAAEALGPKADEARLPDWDVEGLLEAATQAGVDVTPFQRSSDDFDEDKLRELLDAEGLNVEAYNGENYTFALSRAKKGPVAERMAEVSDLAKTFLGDTVVQFREKIEANGLDTPRSMSGAAKGKSLTA
jgi:predicted phage-related endonuclease